MSTTAYLTVADLEHAALPEGRWELIAGELVAMSPTGIVHNRIVAGLLARLNAHLSGQRLGELVMPDSGIVLAEQPPVVRSPDLGFIRAERCPPAHEQWGFYRVVPDFVVEVRSPRDSVVAIMAKAAMWREAGTVIVWVVDPTSRMVTGFGGEQTSRVLIDGEVLDASTAVPGFRMSVAEVFAPLG